MSKKDTSKYQGSLPNEVEEKPSPQEEPKDQDKVSEEDDAQEGRIPLEEQNYPN